MLLNLACALALVAACGARVDVAAPPATSSGAGGGEGCDETPCKLTLPQCGCPDGQMCAIQGDVVACTFEPPGAPGWNQPCDAICAAGFTCLKTGEGPAAPGICHKLCDDDRDCGVGGLCALEVTGTQATVAACSVVCDLVALDSCPEDSKCIAAQETAAPERWYTFCSASGAAMAGDACAVQKDCAAGLFCVGVDAIDQCVPWCHLATPDCASGSCVALDPPLVVNDLEYGFCL
jgi:hypothetical protein